MQCVKPERNVVYNQETVSQEPYPCLQAQIMVAGGFPDKRS